MPVDNKIYERDSSQWWSENSHLTLLRGMIPPRIEYLRQIYQTQSLGTLEGKKVLDLGCGGGLFAEALAKMGAQVTGIDPSARSLETAKIHAASAEMKINYQVGCGENLPCQDNVFDLVCCCDVLEHVNDVNAVIKECVRVLKHNSLFLYDTINRTWMSRLFIIKLFQEWPWLKIMPPHIHHWQQFIKPFELRQTLIRNGLHPLGSIGLSPGLNPLVSFKRMAIIRKIKNGQGRYADLAQHMVFRLSPFKLMNYMGYASKKEPSHN